MSHWEVIFVAHNGRATNLPTTDSDVRHARTRDDKEWHNILDLPNLVVVENKNPTAWFVLAVYAYKE